MSLQDEIDLMRKEIRTDGYSMSIGEWISLYDNKEIDIHPEFQRFYRWSETQKSNLIESILLGIPIPPIFVSQRQDGVWDVVDGLQRLSTIYQFVGILKDDRNDYVEPLVLEKTRYLTSLQGKKWNIPDDDVNSLSIQQRLLIKRSKISVSIILRESDDVAKYELFQRLNTGGSTLTPQEVRNCILLMANSKAFEWLTSLACHESFLECISLSDKNIIEKYDMELALRFVVFSHVESIKYDDVKDVSAYITDNMIKIAENPEFNYDHAEKSFKGTFDALADALGSNSFKKYLADDDRFKGGFLLSPYEVIAYGIGFNHPNIPSIPEIIAKIKSIHSDDIYKRSSGSGVAANSRLPRLIPFGRDLFKK
ncbi:DUF262 domain-containing protein [Desulfoluna sp.]|uniref:DUF262 domain-containing protein n=1 Tax=Desulfoluna sp. TaxID=2045199 RepID=UPI0026390640|nr:DUF262 domain-containing protein [Desulfoluna sp.]